MDNIDIQTIIYGMILGVLIHDNWKISRLIDKHQEMIRHVSVTIMDINIRVAMVDLQLGNIPYSTVKELIKESGLHEQDIAQLNAMLEEIVFAYNIKKDE